MAEPISALDHNPFEFVCEVSTDAIEFYVDELSGIYLPEEFRAEHAEVFDVKYWKPEKRLYGKFGRFTLEHIDGDDTESLDGILVMGTTIGLSDLDRDGYMRSLRHYTLQDIIPKVLDERGLSGQEISVNRADFGSTVIRLGEDGSAESIRVDGSSIDLGRALADGRQQTCSMFEQLLGEAIQVVNDEPEPRERERIVS